jgi:hypothetical protein
MELPMLLCATRLARVRPALRSPPRIFDANIHLPRRPGILGSREDPYVAYPADGHI